MDYPVGRRVAAIRALVDEGRAEFAKRLSMRGLSATNLKEIENGSRPLHDHERQRIAEACDISPAFFTMDLAKVEDEGSLRGYVESLDNELTSLKSEVATYEPIKNALVAAIEGDAEAVFHLESARGKSMLRLTRIEGAGAPPIPGETGRRLQANEPTQEDPQRADSDPDSDAASGTGG